MYIEKTRIINIIDRISALPSNSELRISIKVSSELKEKLSKIGFPQELVSGYTILPNPLEPVSEFNSYGKWNKLKNKPKENRYITTVLWSWKEWSGKEREESRDVYRDCYQRELLPPPSIEITYVTSGENEQIISPIFQNKEENYETIRHTINLFLKLFGQCEIVNSNFASFSSPDIKRLNWQLLPQGKYPWEKISEHINAIAKNISDKSKLVILNRQETIRSYLPDEIYTGAGGFSEYIAYVFKVRGIVVLESIRKDNAIYVFGENWLDVSKLTKAEVLAGSLHQARIVHSKDWKEKLAQLMIIPNLSANKITILEKELY